MSEQSNFDRYLKTYSGQQLLEKYSLSDEGVWHIRGEDPNCDLGGPHYQPDLGYIEGKLGDVIHAAVELDGFWSWGGGGSISRHSPPKVRTAKKVIEDNAELERLLKERAELDKKISKLSGK